MNLSEVLEGLEKKNEVISFVESQIDLARKDGSKKANTEAKNVRERYKKSWIEFDLNPDSDDFESKLIDVRSKLDEYDQLKNGKSKQDNSEILKLSKQIEVLTEKYETEAKEKKELKRSSFLKTVNTELLKELSNNNILKPEIVSKAIISDLNLDGDDLSTVHFKGDEQLTIKDGVKKFAEANKELVSSQGHPGGDSGARDSSSQGGKPPTDDIEARKKFLRQKMSNHI